jgi:uncharacterized protein
MTTYNEHILATVKEYIHSIDLTAKVLLYGSRARGDERADSDWDILILIDSEASVEKEMIFRHKLYDLELETGESFSTYVFNKREWKSKFWMTPLYKNIIKEGIQI